ncbi:hypothetical protein HYV74_00595 [Candidatus Uhrbacteria bacterium]|nr:hypothetical protein [Candidatus Uhrbacteria bacterium]
MANHSHQCARCLEIPDYGTFLSVCWRDGEHFPAERRAFGFALAAAALLGILVYVAYWAFLIDIPGFAGRIGPHLPYVVLSAVAVTSATWHLKAVRRELSAMMAMMVGMTFGMIAGFLAGYLVGATNGMFTGSVFGVLVGCALGWYVSDCCAMMSRMEGMMAGLMSGTMGAMTAVMLLNDRLAWFTPFLLAVCLVVLSGCSYLTHREYRERQGVQVTFRGTGFLPVLVMSFLSVTVTLLIMVGGPKSVLFLGF